MFAVINYFINFAFEFIRKAYIASRLPQTRL